MSIPKSQSLRVQVLANTYFYLFICIVHIYSIQYPLRLLEKPVSTPKSINIIEKGGLHLNAMIYIHNSQCKSGKIRSLTYTHSTHTQ